MRVAITGANGQLGTDLVAAFGAAGHETVPLVHAALDIVDAAAVVRVLDAARPDVVVNTAARHHVERCEEQPGAAYEVNAIGPRNLARWTADHGARLLQVSTDYVFDGRSRQPYDEDAPARPLNVYGSTKLAGEIFVQATCPRSSVVRVSGLYGTTTCRDKGPNFVDRMLGLGRERDVLRVVDDEVLTPTPTWALARQFVALAEYGPLPGVVHATCGGACSWFEFMTEIARLAELPARIEAAALGEFPAKVPRPGYSVLDNRRLRDAGIDVLPDWRAGLARYLEGVTAAVRP